MAEEKETEKEEKLTKKDILQELETAYGSVKNTENPNRFERLLLLLTQYALTK